MTRQLLAFGVLVGAACVGAAHELWVRQPGAYLGPGGGPPWWGALLGGIVGAACGATLSARVRHPLPLLPWALLGGAMTTGASGLLWFTAVVRPALFPVVAYGVPLLGGATLALALGAAFRALWFRAAALGILEQAITPWFVLGTTLGVGTALGALTSVGFLRAATLLGLTLAALASFSVSLLGLTERRPLRHARLLHALALGEFVVGLIAFSHGGRLVTLTDLYRHESAVVYTHTTPRSRVVVTSAQGAFALFIDGKLEVSTLDGYRYAEALVHPALAVAPRRARVAVLGGGKGLVEREVLRYPEVVELDVVAPDAAVPRVARRLSWLRSASHGALDDVRVTLVEEEPIVWLDADGPLYDVIIVDLADPVGYVEAKSYSVYFYARLRARLTPEGVAVTQSTSPFRSPEAVQTIRASAQAAGLVPRLYRAPLPSLGEWGFLLLGRRPLPVPRRVPPDLAFLDPATLAELFVVPPDILAPPNPVPNELHDLRLVEVLERELHAD